MDKPKSSGDDVVEERLKKRAAVSTDGRRSLKDAQAGSSCGNRRLEVIPVPHCRTEMEEEVEVKHLVRARDAKEGAVLPTLCGESRRSGVCGHRGQVSGRKEVQCVAQS